MFLSKSRAYLSEAIIKLALPANIRLDWEGLQNTNTLAYLKNLYTKDKKAL